MGDKDHTKDKPLQPLDRTMQISCQPELVWLKTDAPYVVRALTSFSLVESNPAMPASTVHPQLGTINITALPQNGYSDNIDITLVLDQSALKGPDGTPITGPTESRWALDGEGPTYKDSHGHKKNLGYCWFCEIIDRPTGLYNVSPPIKVKDMVIERSDDTHLLVDDQTGLGGDPTAFSMGFVLTGYGNLWIPIDPVISTKGNQSNNP